MLSIAGNNPLSVNKVSIKPQGYLTNVWFRPRFSDAFLLIPSAITKAIPLIFHNVMLPSFTDSSPSISTTPLLLLIYNVAGSCRINAYAWEELFTETVRKGNQSPRCIRRCLTLISSFKVFDCKILIRRVQSRVPQKSQYQDFTIKKLRKMSWSVRPLSVFMKTRVWQKPADFPA